ncbi:MAG: AMP-binding protein [Leptolyngbyaceae cyanobacterium]
MRSDSSHPTPNSDLAPIWIPSEEQIQGSHIAALMRELGLDTYPELHRWSVEHWPEYWQRMIQQVGIQFRQLYTDLVDFSQAVTRPQWLINARLNIVDSCFQAPGDAIAIYYQSEGRTLQAITYAELRQLTNQVANGLVAAGFQPGDAIAVVLPMTVEAVAIYLGIIAAGCVVVSIADSFSVNEIATRLKIAKTKAVFTQDLIQRAGRQFPLYTKVMDAQAPTAIVLPLTDSLSVDLRQGDRAWAEFLSSREEFEAIPCDPGAHTNILFSSGTTGEPKAIPWTHTTPIKCAVDAYLHHDIHPSDILTWPTSLGWMMGPWLIYASLINQAAIGLYYGAPTRRDFGQFIQNAKVTMLGLVPSLVSTWKTTACMEGLDWSAIKAFSSTGECSNAQDMRYLMALAGNKPVIEYCGGTEIGGAYLTGTLVQPCIPATFSTPALGLDLVILDPDNQPATKGEAFIIGPSIGLSTELLNRDHEQVYFANTPQLEGHSSLVSEGQRTEEKRQTAIHNSKFIIHNFPLRRHGDQIEHLPNGYYRAHGRVDDTMNLGGIKVSSMDIERVVNQVEGIAEAVAIATTPPTGGPSQLVIYAVVTNSSPDTSSADKSTLLKTLQAAIKQQLNPLFKIHDLVLIDALPRTASNKVMRRVLRDRYHQETHSLSGANL